MNKLRLWTVLKKRDKIGKSLLGLRLKIRSWSWKIMDRF